MKPTTPGHTPPPDIAHEEPPPILKKWKNLYLLVFFTLILCITIFRLFKGWFS